MMRAKGEQEIIAIRSSFAKIFSLLIIISLCSLPLIRYIQSIWFNNLSEYLPVSIESVSLANYSADPRGQKFSPVRLEIIQAAIHDYDTLVTDSANRYETVVANLNTPVPTVTALLYTATMISPTPSPITQYKTPTLITSPTATTTHTPTIAYTSTSIPLTSTYTYTPVPPISTYTNTPIPSHPTSTYTFTPVPIHPTSTYTYTPTPSYPTSTKTFTPVPPTNTSPPPTNTSISLPDVHVVIIKPPNSAKITTKDSTKFEAVAWDPVVGSTNGSGITQVRFIILDSSGNAIWSKSDDSVRYCTFPKPDGKCGKMGEQLWGSLTKGETYTLKARAQAIDGRWSEWVSVTWIKK